MKIIIAAILSLMMISSVPAQVTTDMVSTDLTNQAFITLQGASINSMGEFKESWDQGSGIYAGYATLYSNQWALVFETGYISFQHNEEMELGDDPKFTIVPLAVGGRYYIVADRFRPFLLAMSGVNIVSQTYETAEESVDKTSAHLHFQVGIGLGILLFGQLEIEGQAKYNSHVLEASLPYNITGMEYGVALNWHL